MKNKPTRHKAENTFKFQPFAERISSIDVDVFHRIGHRNEEDYEDSSTYFHQTMAKWNVLNLSESYEALRKELPMVQTLPLLLVQKEQIVDTLCKYLNIENKLSLQPALELVVALARDLHHEFYPFYPRLLTSLVAILKTRDVDQLEWTFTCLAYLFKFLWRCLVKDLDIVFDNLLPLLADNRPTYVNNFAAESFAFVARKVKDRKAFLLLILESLKVRPDGVAGCGLLLFEVMRGVPGQFHSCAESLLPMVLKSLADEAVPQESLFQLLTHTITSLLGGIRSKKCELFWSSITEALQSFVCAWKENNSERNGKNILLVLKLLLQGVEYKDCVMLTDAGPVVRVLIELLKLNLPIEVMSLVSSIAAALLLSSNTHLSQEHSSGIMMKLLAVPHSSVLMDFVVRVFDYSSFEALVLPHLLSHCQQHNLTQEQLYLLTKLILHKMPPCKTGLELKNWQRYPLDFSSCNISNKLQQTLTLESITVLMANIEECLCTLVVLPHIHPQDKKTTLNKLKVLIEILCESLSNDTSMKSTIEETEGAHTHENTSTTLLLLSTALESVVHMVETDEDLQNVCDLDLIVNTLLPYASKPVYVDALRALDNFLSAYKVLDMSEEVCLSYLMKLHDSIVVNLSSPYHIVRVMTCHLFSLFERSPEGSSSDSIVHWSLFSLCLAAELVPATIHEYREKQQHLQNLEFAATQISLSKNPQFNKVPLYYLLGTLYINFKLLWEPVCLLVATYANGMQRNDFWSVFAEQLQIARNSVKVKEIKSSPDPVTFSEDTWFLTEWYSSAHEFLDKPDFVYYRILLWKAMLHFPDVCSAKTKDVSPLFLTFLEEEYFKSNASIANTWNVKIVDLNDTELENDTEEKDESKDDNDVDKIKKKLLMKPPKSIHSLGYRTGKSLLAHMAVFAKFKNPKGVHSEEKLRKVYFNFLSNKNPDVQKLALDCIMTYKYQYLVPYRDHLYGLLDEKTFKSELTMFRVDTESSLIQATHRADLMPVIMRIMYSKMMTRVGTQRGGNSAGQFKRSIVLRFLAGCREEELIMFVDMAFRLYSEHTREGIVVMVDTIMNSIDLQNVIPPKRLQSSINLLGVIFDQFGGLMGKQLVPHLFRILLCISATVGGILSRREMVHAGYLPTLRSVRTSCLEVAARFFDRFDKFDWTSADIDATFNALVFPWLDKLAIEGIHSPTALLKLFLVWSEYPRYFVLLAKHPEGDTSLTPLPHIIKLLEGNKTHPSVVTAIMELVERLLTLKNFGVKDDDDDDDDEGEKAAPLIVNNVLPVDCEAISKLSLSEEINYGSTLLLSHIPSILERLRRKLIVKNRSLNRLELVVLSRVSELVWDPITSDVLLKLLLPLLMKKSSGGEEVTVPLILTMMNLLKNVDDPDRYIRGLTPLFGQVCGPGPRKLLCQMMETVALRCTGEKRDTLVASVSLVSELNAWDKKWLDQPDFMRRLDAFKRIHEMIDVKAVDFDLGLIVLHICFHYLRVEKDLSLRDSSGYCLKQLAPALCKQYSDNSLLKDVLVNGTVLQLVRQAIRDNTDNVYNEAIGLLGAMARECHQTHTVLSDLYVLTNESDPEVDFFENLQHLQTHRKARALLKFCQVMKTSPKAPNPRTLTQFILPIASSFLLSEKYASKHTIVDAAIETIGTVCRLLPWAQYSLILRYYLTKLRTVIEHQRQLVRVVVEILDAFHFDLSLANDKRLEEVTSSTANKLEIDLKKNNEEENDFEASAEITSDDTNSHTAQAGETLIELDENLEGTLVADGKSEESSSPHMSVDQIILNRSAAIQASVTISQKLLPQLHNCMAERSSSDKMHKVNRKKGGGDQEEEEVLRVPLSLAVVKLLKRLPKEILDQNLPGILMKLCTFLKSKLESVRRVARHTLQKIMVTLGPEYLPHVLNEMCLLLTRGFHVHVLVFSIHAILVSLKDFFKCGDMDLCLTSVLECCKMDVFGATAEEKKIAGITGKVQEARSTKSFDTFQIVAQYISEKCLTDLVLPIQNVLVRSHSFKVTGKATECLRNIVVGLSLNKFVTLESLLIFMYGTVSESIPDLKEEKKEVLTEEKRRQQVLERPDTFLIVPPPRNRHGVLTTPAKSAAKTNAHILVEFGLKLFVMLLKREKLRSPEYRPYVEPVLPIISDCLESKHIKVTTLALQCLCSLFKIDLPTMKEHISKIVSLIFSLLHQYAAAGLCKGESYDLVAATFKAVVVLVRDVSWHVISQDQLKALLLYAEQDLHAQNKQATAFSLLRAILSRKLKVPEMADVMTKIASLSIVSESASVRLQCRQVFHQYLMDYPMHDKLEQHLAFYISQLSYEVQSGRESALEMLHTIISTFPVRQLTKQSGLLFVTMGARLENDDVPKCRKMVAQCITSMLERLPEQSCDQLFDIPTQWLKDRKVAHRRLAAQMCGLFVAVEKEKFEKRLTSLLPIVISQFGRGSDDNQPGRFVRAPVSNGDAHAHLEVRLGERSSDHHIFQVLQLVLKICDLCPHFLSSPVWQGFISIIAENAHALLSHDHEWVRLASCQVLGHVFASLKPSVVAAHSYKRSSNPSFLSSQTSKKLKTLILDLCAQFHPDVGEQLADQVVKNLVFLGRVMKEVEARPDDLNGNEDEDGLENELDQVDISLLWMVKRMRRVVNTEVVQFPKSIIMRTSVFKWIGALALDTDREALIPYLHNLLAPLVREMAVDGESKSELRHLATDIAKVIKNKVGMEEYTRCVAVLEMKMAARRTDRKKLRTAEVITNPEMAAKRKIDKQLKKKDAKKRKIDEMKGRKMPRKKRLKEVDMEIS